MTQLRYELTPEQSIRLAGLRRTRLGVTEIARIIGASVVATESAIRQERRQGNCPRERKKKIQGIQSNARLTRVAGMPVFTPGDWAQAREEWLGAAGEQSNG